jgi:oligopeptide transport system substrate-binding protein
MKPEGPRARRALATLLTLVTALAALAGCVGQPPRAQEPSGTLRWSLEGVSDITRLDPARLGGNQSNIPVYLIFGGLVRINDRLQVVGDGAERWQISQDGLVYTFTLRRDLRYGNGDPVTAQQFADSFARAIAPDTGTGFALTFLANVIGAADVAAGRADSIAGVKALDDQTLQITLDSPRGYFLSQLTYGLMYLSPPAIGDGEEWLSNAYGTGPFRVKSRDPGKGLVLEGNPYYWAGPPGVKEVTFSFFPTTGAALTAYQAGQLDIMGSVQAGVPAERLDEVRDVPGFQTINTTVTRYIGFNNAVAPFNNVFVRQAFAQSVDKDALASRVLGGTVAAADRILPQGFPGSSQGIEPLGFDPVNARAALGLAGYVSGADLPPVALTYDQGDVDVVRVAEALQAGWRDTLGIDVRLEPVPVETLIARLDAMIADPADPDTAMQMYVSVWGADYPDPQNFISLQLHSQSPYNNGHWENAEFDRLTDEADRLSAEQDKDERYKLYRDAEQIAINEVGWLPLYNPQVTLVIRPTVTGLVPTVTPQGILAADWTKVRVAE